MPRPNIIVTFADDQRFDTIARHGNRQIHTPNLDRLADRGTSYLRAQHGGSTHGAVCAPSRAQLHTGLSLFHTSDNLTPCEPTIARKPTVPYSQPHPTLGSHLRNAGYDTFGVGKWHNGDESFLASFNEGKMIFMGGMSSHYNVAACELPAGTGKFANKYGRNGHSTDLFTSAAVDFLSTRSADDEKPFFLYVAYTAPHDPRQTHWRFRHKYKDAEMDLPPNFLPQHPFKLTGAERDEFIGEYPRHPDEARMHTADYYACIEHMDEGLGKIHALLREKGLEDNTIVAHTADHGIAIGQHGLFGKGDCYDHSIRVPLIVAGPGFEKGIDDGRLCHQHDVFPTLLDHAGVNNAKTDFVHLQSATPRETIGSAFGTQIRTLRNERLKLIEYNTPQGRVTQLFDSVADPFECHDLSKDPAHDADVKSLRLKLNAYLHRTNDPLEGAFL